LLNAGSAGPTTWLRHCKTQLSRSQRTCCNSIRGLCSRAPSPAATRLDKERVGHVREQSQSQVLSAQPSGSPPTGRGSAKLGTDFRCDVAPAQRAGRLTRSQDCHSPKRQQPADLTVRKLLRGLSLNWAEQRKRLGFIPARC
jgi:hypothetical protein